MWEASPLGDQGFDRNRHPAATHRVEAPPQRPMFSSMMFADDRRSQFYAPLLPVHRILCSYSLIFCLVFLASLRLSAATNNAEDKTPDLDLTQEERGWLSSHPVIRVSFDPAFAPIEFADKSGEYRGIAADYLKLVEQRLGVRFDIVTPASWMDALELARARTIDLLPATAQTIQRSEYLIFTEPHIKIPAVVITAHKDVYNWELETLKKMKIAVVEDYAWDDWISEEYPEIALVRVPDIETGLQTTSFEASDIMVGDLASSSYFIGKTGISNLRVARQLDQSLDLSMAVRSDWPVLRDILDKALESIDDAQRQSIADGWIHLAQPAWWQNTALQLTLLGIVAGLGTIIFGTLLWNRRLRHQVAVRTQALEEAQLRLIQAAKLESVGRLAAGVAHEVKNPLAIIQMGLDYLRPAAEKNEDDLSVVGDMEDAVSRADTVIKGLLDFSREKRLDQKPGSINEVIRRSLRLVKHELSQHNIALNESLDEGVPPLTLDANKLQQVFINLFMNATQAMERDGVLEVRSYTKTLDSGDELLAVASGKFKLSDRVVVVEVKDTGPGIEESKLETVFDPFFTTKPVGKGTGLGLSVSRSIVELHHGYIHFRNGPERGAIASLYFKVV